MMRRRVFAVASAISLLLCLGTLGLWMQSYTAMTGIGSSFGTSDRIFYIAGDYGTCWCGTEKYHAKLIEFTQKAPRTFYPQPRFGFGTIYLPHDALLLGLPFWLVLTVLTAFAFSSVLWAFRRKRPPETCLVCDYNLTGNTSGVCPECGTPVPKAPADGRPGTA